MSGNVFAFSVNNSGSNSINNNAMVNNNSNNNFISNDESKEMWSKDWLVKIGWQQQTTALALICSL